MFQYFVARTESEN